MRSLIALSFGTVLSLFPASAEPDRLSVLLGSHHANIQLEVEELNPGVFLEWDVDRRANLLNGFLPETGRSPSTVVGAFRNSFGDGALALAVAMPLHGEEQFEVDLILGGAWYPGNGDRVVISVGDFVPLAALRITYDSAFMLALPGDGETFDALFAFGLSFPLNGGR